MRKCQIVTIANTRSYQSYLSQDLDGQRSFCSLQTSIDINALEIYISPAYVPARAYMCTNADTGVFK